MKEKESKLLDLAATNIQISKQNTQQQQIEDIIDDIWTNKHNMIQKYCDNENYEKFIS